MPAYIHHHDGEPPFMICPSCERVPASCSFGVSFTGVSTVHRLSVVR